MRTARRAGLIDQVIEQLRGQITSGVWAIGGRIPTESELAQLTGTSRNTVREAVQSLVHAGLLERRQGSGTYVLASSEMAGAVSRQVAGAHHVHVLEVRRALEAGAARLAATRRTQDDIAEQRRLIAARNEASRAGSQDGVVAYDVLVHRAIVRSSHNPVLIELYENFLGALGESVRSNLAATGQIRDEEHVALVDAIEARDGERAASEAACYLDQMIEEAKPE
ncbi:MAG: FadR family transcriptional regulator [Kineosporiaceae bacterium]|nr:FadR family transcriptional regulator [Kineosporiaceae bacterium]